MNNDYFQTDNFKELLRSFENKYSIGESIYLDVDDFADLSDYYLSIDAPDMAMDCIDMGLRIHKEDSTLLVVKSAIHIYRHEFSDAASIIYSFDDSDPDVLYQKAQLEYALANDVESSVRCFRQWMEQNNDRESYTHIISSFVELSSPEIFSDDLLRGWISEYIDRFSPMTEDFFDITIADICREHNYADLYIRIVTQILDENPYYPNGFKLLGLAQYTVEDFEAAIQSFDFALAINPDDNEILLGKAHTLLAMGDSTQCIDLFRTYIDNGGDVVQNIPLCQCLFEIGENEEALARLDKLDAVVTAEKVSFDENASEKVVINPDDKNKKVEFDFERYTQIYIDLGEIFYANTYFSRSIEAMQKVLEVDNTNADAYFTIGSSQLMLNQFDDAIRSFGTAIGYAQDKLMMCIDVVMTLILMNYEIDMPQLVHMLDYHAVDSESPYVRNISAVKAFAYFKSGDREEFLHWIGIAAAESPDFVKRIFTNIFPEEIEPADYASYAIQHSDKFFPPDDTSS